MFNYGRLSLMHEENETRSVSYNGGEKIIVLITLS